MTVLKSDLPGPTSKLAGHKLIMAEAMYWLCGYPTTEIADFFGMAHQNVQTMFRSYGVAMRDRSECIKLTYRRGRPARGCSHRPRELHFNWKGGRMVHDGYVLVLMPEHPRADNNGYVLEHILVLEEKLGRPLGPDEIAHHDNEIKTDNAPKNVLLMTNRTEHMKLHWKRRKGQA